MKRLAIFAGYDKNNIIDDYVLFYLKELNKFSDIIYVADCEMQETELNKVKDYTIKSISEKHGEYDFGSYKRGYIYAKENNILENYDYLILCNDSVYGPFFNFKEIVENMENKNTDVWGIFKHLENGDITEHLQSFFISIHNKIFISKEYNDFIMSIKKEKNKWDVIINYELKMSLLFQRMNFTISYFLDSSIIKKPINYNLPLYYTYYLISNYKFPFLKIMAIREPNISTLNANQLLYIIKIIKDTYDIRLIINHLNRIIHENNEIKKLLQKFNEFNKYFIKENLLSCCGHYNLYFKYQLIFKIANFIKITVNIPDKFAYYKDFNFLLTKK